MEYRFLPHFQLNSLLKDLAIFSLDVSGYVRKEIGMEGFWSMGVQRSIRDLLSSTAPPPDTDPMDGYGKWGDKPVHLAYLYLRIVEATSKEWLACFESWRRFCSEFYYLSGNWLQHFPKSGEISGSGVSDDIFMARSMLIELRTIIRASADAYDLKVQELTPQFSPYCSTLLPEPSAWDRFAVSAFVAQMSSNEYGATVLDYAPPVDERVKDVGRILNSRMFRYSFFHAWNRITSSATPAQIMAMQWALDNPEGYWRNDMWCPNALQMTTLVTTAITTHAALCSRLKDRAAL